MSTTSHHLSHHHHLRSLSQRNSSSSYVDSGASASASGAPFSSHLRELETFRRKSTSGSASNPIDTPQSGEAGGTGGPVSSEGGSAETTSARTGHHHQQTNNNNHHYNRHQQANGYALSHSHNHHHHHHQDGAAAAMHLDSSSNHLITPGSNNNASDCQGYKPNAPHIQGEWNDRAKCDGFGKRDYPGRGGLWKNGILLQGLGVTGDSLGRIKSGVSRKFNSSELNLVITTC